MKASSSENGEGTGMCKDLMGLQGWEGGVRCPRTAAKRCRRTVPKKGERKWLARLGSWSRVAGLSKDAERLRGAYMQCNLFPSMGEAHWVLDAPGT